MQLEHKLIHRQRKLATTAASLRIFGLMALLHGSTALRQGGASFGRDLFTDSDMIYLHYRYEESMTICAKDTRPVDGIHSQ